LAAQRLPMSFEAGTVDDTAAEPCDFTAPVRGRRKLDEALAAFKAEWNRHARYHLTVTRLARSYQYETSQIGHWLPLAEARALASRLNDEEKARFPNLSSWTRTSYGIELHLPKAVKGDRAHPGDLVIHERVTPSTAFSLTDSCVVRQFLVISAVTSVTDDGRIARYRDCNGEHGSTPRRPWVMSADEVDVTAALQGLIDSERERGHWGVEFHGLKHAVAFLERFIRHQAPVYPALDATLAESALA
jgi:hypothetical protein